MLRRIVAEGHELANHGYDRVRLVKFTSQQFRNDVAQSKNVPEQQSGTAARSYRAPSYSVAKSNLWVHDVLLETGHCYISSIAPIQYKEYGLPDAPRFSHFRKNEQIVSSPR